MDFSALQAQNEDTVAWLTVDGTVIDYPVVQAPDNDYYLTRSSQKENSPDGAIFLDYRNAPDLTDFNNIIYGHNLKNGRMLTALNNFKDPAFFAAHPTGRLWTPTATYTLEFYAVAVTTPTSDHYKYIFPSPTDRSAHLTMIRSTAQNWRDLPLDPTHDHLLVLSTCSYEFDDARTILIARLSPAPDWSP
jgi:sortase B